MSRIRDSELYKKITSSGNIFTAIYGVESYIFERNLLEEEDISRLNELKDKYNVTIINKQIEECQTMLDKILCSEDKLFDVTVYFKYKKIDAENDSTDVKARPIHVADLTSQICMVCMLNVLMFEDSHEKGRLLSEISNMLPSYFYGNVPSTDLENLFVPWQKKYKEYTQNVIDSLNQYKKNKKYKYEISLDLKNFFPSINPNIIYKIIKESFQHLYDTKELECLDRVLIKLLYFNLKNKPEDYEEYYKKAVKDKEYDNFIENGEFYTVGIPQGLPQAYFFGNLCMVQVERYIKKSLEGEAFYYVDDSTIFSNVDLSAPSKFNIKINELNDSLAKYCRAYQGAAYRKCDKFSRFMDYQIGFHEQGKSSYTDINEEGNEWTGLFFIARQTSTISHELFSIIDDDDDFTVKKKVNALLHEIDKEIEKLRKSSKTEEERGNGNSNKLKQLIRYKKFYSYRLRLLQLNEIEGEGLFESEAGSANKEYIDYKTKYEPLFVAVSLDDIADTKELLEDDIFWTESMWMIKSLRENEQKQGELIDNLKKIETRLYGGKIDALYYQKTFDSFKHGLSLSHDRYHSLSAQMKSHFLNYKGAKTDYIVDKIEAYSRKYIIDPTLSSSFSDVIDSINTVLDIGENKNTLNSQSYNKDSKNKGYFNSFVLKHSTSYQRIFCNALYSHLFSVPISEDTNIIKTNGKTIRYFELRLLMFLRNQQFDAIEFKAKINSILDKHYVEGYQKIDFTLLEVLPIFRRYVFVAEDVDRLILLHKYVNSLWKNGSKFLYFYTLHNEEHAVELIKAVVKLSRAINLLTLKQSDYFILFAACYLHDISMVIYPDVNDFISDKGRSEEVYTKFKDNLKRLPDFKDSKQTKELKKIIVENYREVNDFFETKIRNEHPITSANFIKRSNIYLDRILIKPEKQYIADVSEAHGYDLSDVYSIRSKAKTDTINQKYLMILLRLADLMDMEKDRVSNDMLRQNIKHMPRESQFHWISHLAIDKCEMRSDYYHNTDLPDKHCQKDSVVEEFTVQINLNIKRLQHIDEEPCKKMNCTHNKSEKTLEIKIFDNLVRNKTEKNEPCTNCYFQCRWMKTKNEYLFDELFDLQRYLRRTKNNFYKSKMKVVLKYDNLNVLPAEYIDIVKDKITK